MSVKSRANARQAKRWEKKDGGYDAVRDRTQRHTLALRDVDYIIRAQIEMLSEGEHPAKYRDQFRRRVKKGRCFARPYLGCREFAAAFAKPNGLEQPIDCTEELGRMLLDMTYQPNGSRTPVFFPARLEKGILRTQNIQPHGAP